MKCVWILTFSFILLGCASKYNPLEPEIVIGHDDPMKELVQLSAEHLDELRLIAKTNDFRQYINLSREEKEQRAKLAAVTLPGFDIQTSINFHGEAHKMAEVIAATAGYKFMGPTQKPRVPVIVSLNRENTKLMDVLRELGAKTGKSANVQVFTEPTRILKFDYVLQGQ